MRCPPYESALWNSCRPMWWKELMALNWLTSLTLKVEGLNTPRVRKTPFWKRDYWAATSGRWSFSAGALDPPIMKLTERCNWRSSRWAVFVSFLARLNIILCSYLRNSSRVRERSPRNWLIRSLYIQKRGIFLSQSTPSKQVHRPARTVGSTRRKFALAIAMIRAVTVEKTEIERP